MKVIHIEGGRRLFGRLEVHGAKNSVLPILAATIIGGGQCRIENCPDISDVDASVRILKHLGCSVSRGEGSVTVDSGPMDRCDIPDELMREMRSSVIFLGAILARFGEAGMSMPGGCELGARPIDLHLSALRQMGAELHELGGKILCRAPKLCGTTITLPIPSVGATENIMLAASAAEGETVIVNAAREPEIVDLARFMCAMGAKVEGAGGTVLRIAGRQPLHGAEHRIIGDRIVAATYMSALASAGGELELFGFLPETVSTVSEVLREAGCAITEFEDGLAVSRKGKLRSVRPIRTEPYPGFPTDAQAPVMAATLCAEGTTVFVENIFENRYRHLSEFVRMGADVRAEGRIAMVCGVPSLHGADVEATDLRGGAALVVAALAASGVSRISGVKHIERGYASLKSDFLSVGAQIDSYEIRA